MARDPIGLAATAGACAVSVGLAAVTATVLGVRLIQPPGTPQAPSEVGFPFYLLVFGTFGGIVLAAAVAWWLLAPIGSTYRRGGLALVSAFATILLMLICMPVDQWLGAPGLAGLLAVCGAAAALFGRRARRAGAL